jgi:Zn finger protein HypA/HybF involved in hydrogenase expression
MENNSEKIMGFQRLVCKNHKCNHLLKEIYFLEGWQQKTNGHIMMALNSINGSNYYSCPKCKGKNYVVNEGDKIILERIIHFEHCDSKSPLLSD